MVRHVSDAGLVEECARLRFHVVGDVMHQHIADVPNQCTACEAACNYQAYGEEWSEECTEDYSETEEGGGADQRTRI